MTNPASLDDVEARWRPLTDAELIVAGTLLDDAWDLLVSRRPTLEDDLTDETVTERNVTRVVATMVIRVLKNPGGWDQESIDDWSGRRNKLIADGILRVTPEELADVTPGRRTRKSVRLVVYGDA